MAHLKRIISGGQTGVDRAALDVAMALEIDHGGWCPAGRRAEDGPIDLRYLLTETPDENYATRTEWNVRDSDATLVLCRGEPSGGTQLTCRLARKYGRPLLIADVDKPDAAERIGEWLGATNIELLNVAGPRASQSPDIGDAARELLTTVLSQ